MLQAGIHYRRSIAMPQAGIRYLGIEGDSIGRDLLPKNWIKLYTKGRDPLPLVFIFSWGGLRLFLIFQGFFCFKGVYMLRVTCLTKKWGTKCVLKCIWGEYCAVRNAMLWLVISILVWAGWAHASLLRVYYGVWTSRYNWVKPRKLFRYWTPPMRVQAIINFLQKQAT